MSHTTPVLHRWGHALARAGAALGLLLGTVAAPAQVLAMPDSIRNRLVTFSAVDRTLINAVFFALGGGTPVHAMGVGNEIWVSEQIGDRVSRWGADGSFLGQVGGGATGGLDNVRGMAQVGNMVYVTNAGTANGAPGAAVAMFSTAGVAMGSFATAATSPSPFGLLAWQGGLLVSSSSVNDDIHRYSLAGVSQGIFQNGSTLNFGQQMAFASNGDILAAGFSSNNIVRLNAATGAVLTTYTAAGARGVAQLGNGNVMWTNAGGAFVLDTGTGASTQVYTGAGRYPEFTTVVPEPASLPL